MKVWKVMAAPFVGVVAFGAVFGGLMAVFYVLGWITLKIEGITPEPIGSLIQTLDVGGFTLIGVMFVAGICFLGYLTLNLKRGS